MKILRQLLLALLLPIFLIGCISMSGIKKSTATLEKEANFSMKQKNYSRASSLFLALADRTKDTSSYNFRLNAINAAILNRNFNFAQKQLTLLPLRSPGKKEEQKIRLFQAELALIQGRSKMALKLLEIKFNERLSSEFKDRYLYSLSEAYKLNGDSINYINTLYKIEKLQTNKKLRLQTQVKILDSLIQLASNSISNKKRSKLAIEAGWLELAYLIKDNNNILEKDFSIKKKRWRNSFPKNSAMDEIFSYYKNNPNQTLRKISNVAIMLPQTGKFSQAAAAIRDGILTKYYSLEEKDRPSLRFYDSADISNIWSLYDKAKNDGAEIIIGPLQKDAVSQLLRVKNLPIPVLALNSIKENSAVPSNFMMFALSPENEARQAAEKIWLDGRRHPAILVPETEWGERISEAFYIRWRSLSDLPANVRKYDPKSKDFSSAITNLFHIDQSKERYKEIQKLLKKSVEFEPRRRSDIDAIFLAARPRQAQSFSPLLQFHRAGDLPLYATSHAWLGELNEQQLADMKGMMLADLPIFANQEELGKLKKSMPNLPNSLIRLYAMGNDAFSLLPHLKRLKLDKNIFIKGKTGRLYMDSKNYVQRQTTWLKLAKKPKIIGYSARLNSLPMIFEPSAMDDKK